MLGVVGAPQALGAPGGGSAFSHCHAGVAYASEAAAAAAMAASLRDLEQRLRRAMRSLHARFADAAPLVQMWVPQDVAWLPADEATCRVPQQLSTDECPFWIADGELAPFRETSCSHTLPRNRGLPGRAWGTGALQVVQCMTEMPEDECPRKDAVPCLVNAGVTSAVAAPVFAGGSSPVAVIELFVRDPVDCSDRMMEIVAGVAEVFEAEMLALGPPEHKTVEQTRALNRALEFRGATLGGAQRQLVWTAAARAPEPGDDRAECGSSRGDHMVEEAPSTPPGSVGAHLGKRHRSYTRDLCDLGAEADGSA